MKIFLSYGHDRNTPIVLRIKQDLEAAGHLVWIDSSEIKTGDDWRRSIVDGLSNTDWTLAFLSQHSVRNPGVCLDELAIALHVKGGTIATILVEAEAAAEAPVSVSHIQWLDMHDWSARLADNNEAGETWYRSKLAEIISFLSKPATQRFAGEIEELDKRLQPISQLADVGRLVDGFIGREWLLSALDTWRKQSTDSRLFWIAGAPGTGKSAFSAWLAHQGRVNVIALNLCRYNIDERRDPARVFRTVAFQIASRLPDYRRLLLDRLLTHDAKGTELERQSAAALFDFLLAEPLRFGVDGGRRHERYLVVIDALDETIRDGHSALVEVLAESSKKLPEWIAIVATSRPEPSILRQFADLKPHVIAAESKENLDDLRAYTRRWLAIESMGAGDLGGRVESVVTASGGNFLYLQNLRDAVSTGLMSLSNLDQLPKGLIGLYERWFRRQFPNRADFEVFRPLFEVLVAAGHPVPEVWLEKIFAWSKPEKAKMLEGLGTLFERRTDGIAPFHKSVRDWLIDEHSAGADFVIDTKQGARRLTGILWPAFESWANSAASALDPFCETELLSQLSASTSGPHGLQDFARLLGDADVIHRHMLIGTPANEDARRGARHGFRGQVRNLTNAWPKGLDASSLWNIAQTFTEVAWRTAATDWDPHAITIWDDIGRPAEPPGRLKEFVERYKEWIEGILLLTTAVNLAHDIAQARPELVPNLPRVFDDRLHKFINKDAQDFATELLTGGREYIPERNLSFLGGAMSETYQLFKNDNRLADWSKTWGQSKFY
jgi:hypothetical protein